MKKYITGILVTLIMVIGILGITNPGFKQPYQLLDNEEGKLIHNYFIFSVYTHHEGRLKNEKGNYSLYKRYIGIALNFYEISPLSVKDE
ncbi:MAG TPA: hypothetical protein VHP12_00545 [Chitinophagaceae bacterium]|nr:hypothetical protein [Chitinophagaceae bacterium]